MGKTHDTADIAPLWMEVGPWRDWMNATTGSPPELAASYDGGAELESADVGFLLLDMLLQSFVIQVINNDIINTSPIAIDTIMKLS